MTATSLSIEPDDFGFSPFLVAPKLCEGGALRGGLGKAHQPACPPKRRRRQILRSFSEVGLFGDQLAKLLNELNEVLAA